MQTYRDESKAKLVHDVDGNNTGYHYITPQDTSDGFQGVHSNGGQYRDVMSDSQAELIDDGYRPASWDGSKYGQNTYPIQRQRQTKRSKFVIIGLVITVLVLIAIAVVVGVVVGGMRSHENVAQDRSVVVDDPSVFTKDPNLHQSFYGLAYTPEGSQLPDCGNKLEDVIKDIQIMSQLTTRIRLYGSDCNQTALVLEAINRTKVNMTVWLGNYNVPNDNNTAYTRQRDILKETLETYGTNHTGGMTVGNEFMLNYVTQLGLTDVNSPEANEGAQLLIEDIEDTKDMLKDMNLSNIPVGNSDAGSFMNTEVLSGVSYGMCNVHAWFANVSVEDSANWTTTFFLEQDQALADSLSNHPVMYIAETGWPTKSSDPSNANNGVSDASPENLQVFLDSFICQANDAGIKYFFFEFKDEPWKDVQFGGVEGWWGLFDSNGTMKNLTIPDCQSP